MDQPDDILRPVAWLIDEDTEHARVILGSDWQMEKMGSDNRLLVTLFDAQEAVFRAVKAERERCLHWCSLGDHEGYATHHIGNGTPKPP